MPSKNRLARIHILKKELGLSEENYRIQLGAYGAPLNKNGEPSSAGFSDLDADRFIAALERQLAGKKTSPHGWGSNKYEDLRPRRGDMGDPKQLRKIEAMWRDVARNPSDEALNSFLDRQTGIKNIIWLKKKHVRAVLTALKEMKN